MRSILGFVMVMVVAAGCVDDDELAARTACPATNVIADPPQFQWTFHPASPTNPTPYFSGILEYGQATIDIGGQTLTTRAYRQAGGTFTIPGPTITMKPGNKYVLRYRNLLPFEPASTQHNVLKDPNVSNLHTHGVHISGESPSDDVTRFFEGTHGGDYVYDIPADHMGGTYWYHAHHHGATFLQVSTGAFGQMIIDDSGDNLPANVAAMTERQLLVAFLDPSVAGTGGDTIVGGTFSAQWTVNGTVNGSLCMLADEWQHFRVLLADRDATEKTFGIGANCEMMLLARDGVWRTTAPLAMPTRSINLTGASRADFAVRCTNDSVITINGSTVASILVNGTGNATVGPFTNGATGTTWSAKRPVYLRDLRGVTTVHTEDIRMGARALNGVAFDETVPNMTLTANQVQQWNVSGSTQHPFHLHVYHVQAQNCTGAYENGEYYDVLSNPCSVRFDLNAATSSVYEGRTIMHCHILEHEDQGAMGWADVVGGLPPPSFPADTSIVGTYGETYTQGGPEWCTSNASCSDGNACDGTETCDATTGTCAAGTSLNCDDGNPCTADSCDATTGCKHVATTCSGPPTCSFDAASATLTVTMNSQSGTLLASSGTIKIGTTICSTTTTTDTIVVNGSGMLTIRGDFAPGKTAEPSGLSEIEFQINNNSVTFDFDAGADTVKIVNTGADVGGDGDQDITLSAATTAVQYKGGTGNDTLDASACTTKVTLWGGAGADRLIGGTGNDTLHGDADADVIDGNAGNDTIYGGTGNDTERGGAGKDTFYEDAAANGSDLLDGGTELDTLTYAQRTTAVFVTLDDGIANEGAAGEADSVTAIENITGGKADDTIVGDALANTLRGGAGNDTISGRGGADTLYGDGGNDRVDGEAGNDKLYGGLGNDTLVGDLAGTDLFVGDAGDDTIIDNTDGHPETVSCGDGIDTVETNTGEDTFTACETFVAP
ncbi:MAG TPA: multicopper oxidase domain-containing protein [Kofleriaceae bacterium]|nr:multicopper oxidase domain-containing protein [Kofleriaceae bacterium]